MPELESPTVSRRNAHFFVSAGPITSRLAYLIVIPLCSIVLLQAACSSSGSSNQGTQPPKLTYSATTVVSTKGTAITPDTPSNSGGAVSSYAVTPTLPSGLSLDTSTGIISGTPTVVAAQATYTVTGTNSGGSSSVGITITVNDLPPAGLSYSTNPATYSAAAAITPNLPSWSSSGGTPTSFASQEACLRDWYSIPQLES